LVAAVSVGAPTVFGVRWLATALLWRQLVVDALRLSNVHFGVRWLATALLWRQLVVDALRLSTLRET
jgi:hypothetical protein